MKAVQFDAFGASDVLHLTDLPDPAPANDELLVRVSAAGVSYVDVRQREGAYNRAETRVGGVKLPSTPGMQAVGRVVAVGPAADRSLVGRKVVAFVDGGAYAELMIAPHGLYVTVPDGVDEAVLSVIAMQGLTAYFALTASTTLRRGESVLVHAAGSGVGSLAVQIAKILGSGKVIGTASSAEKRAHILELRADHAIDYTATNWPQSVLDVTQGKGVDVLLESIGGKVFEQLRMSRNLWSLRPARFDAGIGQGFCRAATHDEMPIHRRHLRARFHVSSGFGP
jgi:NADPH:quinone reductase